MTTSKQKTDSKKNTKAKLKLNVLIAGVGGQGTILASRVLSRAAVIEGHRVLIGELFGSAQRGGPVTSHVRIGEGIYSSLIPARAADVLLGFEPVETLRRATYVKPDGVVIFNTKTLPPQEVKIGKKEYPSLEATKKLLSKIASKVETLDASGIAMKTGSIRSTNMVMLGVLAASGIVPFRKESFMKAIEQSVPKKTLESNFAAFESGFNAKLE